VRFPVTLQLVLVAFVLAVLIAVPVGFFVASRPGGRADRIVTGYSLFAGAQPEFWWGLIFIFVFYFKLGWFPAPLGQISSALSPPPTVTNSIFLDSLIAGDFAVFRSALHHYILPWLTLVFVLSGPIIKMTRQGAEAVLESDFVLYARAAGLPRRRIRRETLRLSLAPVVTLVGILFGFMIGASVLVEFVFSFDGIGAYSVRRTLEVDFPAIQGAVVVMTTIALLIYLAMDILHALLDPRVRLR
jgi:ABC-type dipeptide/oligopeptide/nickel transport system permease component